jgi:hypothetical protein
MKFTVQYLILASLLIVEIGCGVKSKPLPPLKDPWISTGDIEKDREKKFKSKKAKNNSDARIEFAPPPTTEEKEP